MKLILKEDIDDLIIEPESNVDELKVNAPLDLDINEEVADNDIDLFTDETDPDLSSFIVSDELNELRDILIELPEEPMLLLLDNKVIVIAKTDEVNDTYLYCLGDDDEELSLIKMPMSLDEILANNIIIQYTPSNISDVHDKVVELFAKELEPDEEETEEDLTEPVEPSNEDIEIPEEDEEDEENEINS